MGLIRKLFNKKTKHNRIIFIVEDNAFYGKLLEEFLRQKFPDVQEVLLFQSGENCLEAIEKNPSVVLMDYFLDPQGAGKTGLDTIRDIKAQKPKTHVILLSSQTEIEVTVEAVKKYNCHYIKKDNQALKKVEASISEIW